ncbi:hypothetical protein NDU88_010506 [Pleurodeles waltl]|uniref:Uncharacterized protein n=1 Tax=Pleurodeles waltl TaxID=8319 RepID=A0AAV7S1H3_PLEWA|nr:hypothetical protein NDU88_010506 [Pleurodeles waltl]
MRIHRSELSSRRGSVDYTHDCVVPRSRMNAGGGTAALAAVLQAKPKKVVLFPLVGTRMLLTVGASGCPPEPIGSDFWAWWDDVAVRRR